MCYSEHSSASIQCLPPEYPTISTIILFPNALDNLIHRPPIQLFITHNFQRQIILYHVPLHSLQQVQVSQIINGGEGGKGDLQTIISVSSDALIDGEEVKFNAVVIPLI